MNAKHLLLIAGLLMTLAGPAYAFGPGGPMGAHISPENEALRGEVVAYSLLLELKLSPAQRGQIKALLSPLRADFQAMTEKMKTFENTTMKARLTETLAQLKAGKTPEPQNPANDKDFVAFKEESKAMRQKVKPVVEQILALLTPEQKAALEAYTPHRYLGFGPGPGDHHEKGDKLHRNRANKDARHGKDMDDPDDNDGPPPPMDAKAGVPKPDKRLHLMILLSDSFYNAL